MFINVSNHPSSKWAEDQHEAATHWGEIIDLAFPQIDPQMSREEVIALAGEYLSRVDTLVQEQGRDVDEVMVMVAGEFTFTYHLVQALLAAGYRVVTACSRREAQEVLQPDGSIIKTARFDFIQFREY